MLAYARQILISGTTTYAIALMLTNFRYTHAEPIIDAMKGVKNEVRLSVIDCQKSALLILLVACRSRYKA